MLTTPRPNKSAPLNQAQLNLLKLFEWPLSDQQVQDIKAMLQYLVSQVDELGKRVWQENGLTSEDMDNLLKLHG